MHNPKRAACRKGHIYCLHQSTEILAICIKTARLFFCVDSSSNNLMWKTSQSFSRVCNLGFFNNKCCALRRFVIFTFEEFSCCVQFFQAGLRFVFDTLRSHWNVFVTVCSAVNTLWMDLQVALQVFAYVDYVLLIIEFSLLFRRTEILSYMLSTFSAAWIYS